MGHYFVGIREHAAAYGLMARNGDTKTAVVFVHGFGGDAVGTWLQFQTLMDTDTPEDISAWWGHADAYFWQYASTRFGIAEQAASLQLFMASVFPRPKEALATVSEEVLEACGLRGPLAPVQVQAESLLPDRHYEKLVIVGHSLGGVIVREAIRQLIWSLDAPAGSNAFPREHSLPILEADVRLFAPAMTGVEPSNLLAWAAYGFQQIPLIGSWLRPAVSSVAMTRQLVAKPERLRAIQTDTEQFARTMAYRALRAHVVFGAHEDVVERDIYACDHVAPPVEGRNHRTVCKPDHEYRYPLEFVIYGRSRQVRAR